jgi:hypothetical protein
MSVATRLKSRNFPHPPATTCALALLIATLWSISLADLYFTLWARQFTPFIEVNPLANWVMDHHSVQGLAILKIMTTTVATVIFWELRGRRRVELALWLVVAIYFVLALRWSSYTRDAMAQPTGPTSTIVWNYQVGAAQ